MYRSNHPPPQYPAPGAPAPQYPAAGAPQPQHLAPGGYPQGQPAAQYHSDAPRPNNLYAQSHPPAAQQCYVPGASSQEQHAAQAQAAGNPGYGLVPNYHATHPVQVLPGNFHAHQHANGVLVPANLNMGAYGYHPSGVSSSNAQPGHTQAQEGPPQTASATFVSLEKSKVRIQTFLQEWTYRNKFPQGPSVRLSQDKGGYGVYIEKFDSEQPFLAFYSKLLGSNFHRPQDVERAILISEDNKGLTTHGVSTYRDNEGFFTFVEKFPCYATMVNKKLDFVTELMENELDRGTRPNELDRGMRPRGVPPGSPTSSAEESCT